jgi:hypothetical protein
LVHGGTDNAVLEWKQDAANAGKDMSIGFMTIKQGNLVEKRSAVGRRTNV